MTNPVPRPFVRFSAPRFNVALGTATVPVQWAFPGRTPGYFKMDFTVNGVAAPRFDMPSGSGSTSRSTVPTDATSYSVGWNDTDRSGSLSSGDAFEIAYVAGVVPYGYASQLALEWTDGSILASASFAWPHPVVALALAANLTGHADVRVSAIQAPKPIGPGFLGVSLVSTSASGNVTKGSMAALATPAGTPTTIRLGTANYTVTWMNLNGTGNLSRGDHFTISYPTGPAYPTQGTTMTLWLIWVPDGTTFSQISWKIT